MARAASGDAQESPRPGSNSDRKERKMKSTSRSVVLTGNTIFTVLGTLSLICTMGACRTVDAVSKATTSLEHRNIHRNNGQIETGDPGNKIVLIVTSTEKSSTGKIARVFEKALDAHIMDPVSFDPLEISLYGLVGLGSGIFDQAHHASLLEFADALPQLDGTKFFLFSTSGISRKTALKESKMIDDPHTALRIKIEAKGGIIIDEFNCTGFNDNSFLKLFGGMNKGRPNAVDLQEAETFSESLKRRMQYSRSGA